MNSAINVESKQCSDPIFDWSEYKLPAELVSKLKNDIQSRKSLRRYRHHYGFDNVANSILAVPYRALDTPVESYMSNLAAYAA